MLATKYKQHGINIDDVPVITIATDGVSNHSNVMACAMRNYSGTINKVVYVEGGDAVGSYEFNKISDLMYSKDSLPVTKAWNEMFGQFPDGMVYAVYNKGFMDRFLSRWQEQAVGVIRARYFIDIQSIACVYTGARTAPAFETIEAAVAWPDINCRLALDRVHGSVVAELGSGYTEIAPNTTDMVETPAFLVKNAQAVSLLHTMSQLID